jgi:hypothetical protein
LGVNSGVGGKERQDLGLKRYGGGNTGDPRKLFLGIWLNHKTGFSPKPKFVRRLFLIINDLEYPLGGQILDSLPSVPALRWVAAIKKRGGLLIQLERDRAF